MHDKRKQHATSPPNTRFHPTPLCGLKITAILSAGFGLNVFPI
jgi:hypothetical protein